MFGTDLECLMELLKARCLEEPESENRTKEGLSEQIHSKKSKPRKQSNKDTAVSAHLQLFP